MQGEYGKIIGDRIIQDGPQDGKHKNGQLESYPILIIYPFIALREILSFTFLLCLRVPVPPCEIKIRPVPAPCEKTRRARANQKQGFTRSHQATELDEERLATDSRIDADCIE